MKLTIKELKNLLHASNKKVFLSFDKVLVTDKDIRIKLKGITAAYNYLYFKNFSKIPFSSILKLKNRF